MDVKYCKNCKKKYTAGESNCQICGESLAGNLTFYAYQLKNGDESAFNELYHSTQSYTRKMVLYYLTTNAIDTNLAEDCMQEVYLRLHQKIGLFDDTKAAFSTWFETLRKNTILNFCEKMKKHQSEISQEESELLQCEDISRMPEHLSDNDEISSIVSEMIDQLPEEQRICIRKFYMEEMKQDQIAKELGIPVGTVKSRLSKGKQKIGEMVLDLQKRGKKIYSFSPVLIFWWFFQNCAEPCLAAEAALAVTGTTAGVATGTAKATGAAKAAKIGSVSISKVLSTVAVTGIAVGAAIGIVNMNTDSLIKIDASIYEDYNNGYGYTIPVEEDGQWGLINYEGDILLTPSFEESLGAPNENGYAIFRDGDAYHIVGRDGEIYTYEGNIRDIKIGDGDIVVYDLLKSEESRAFTRIYEKLDGTVVYQIEYKANDPYIDHYWYNSEITPLNEGKAYACETISGTPVLIELSLNENQEITIKKVGTVSIDSYPCTVSPRGLYKDGYILCIMAPVSGNILFNPETLERTEPLNGVSTELFPEIDWDSWRKEHGTEEYFLYSAGKLDLTNYVDISYFVYYFNGTYVHHYKNFGCVRVELPNGTSKSVLYDYAKGISNYKLEKAIAIYDDIFFADCDYLAVRNGEEWFYIDYKGNIVSKSYKKVTSFNDEGYALVLESDGNACIIDQSFQVVESIGKTNSIGLYGEVFRTNQNLFYYGEKYSKNE